MTLVQELLISAKHLAAYADLAASRRAAGIDIKAFREAVDLDSLSPASLSTGLEAVMVAMAAISDTQDIDGRAAMAAGLSQLVDGVRLEIAHHERARQRTAARPPPYYVDR